MSNRCKRRALGRSITAASDRLTRASITKTPLRTTSNIGQYHLRSNEKDRFRSSSIDSLVRDELENSGSSAVLSSPELTFPTQIRLSELSNNINRGNNSSNNARNERPVSQTISELCYNLTEKVVHSGTARTGLSAFTLKSPPKVPSRTTRTKIYPISRTYDKILDNVVFVLSGFANPTRRKMKDLAIAMGAKYQVKWSKQCTHLICAFKNTHKYKQVVNSKGRIVREHWIYECHSTKRLLDWRLFKLGRYNYPDSEEEVEVNEQDDMDFSLRSAYGISRQQMSTQINAQIT